jgi:hypothetical protein
MVDTNHFLKDFLLEYGTVEQRYPIIHLIKKEKLNKK